MKKLLFYITFLGGIPFLILFIALIIGSMDYFTAALSAAILMVAWLIVIYRFMQENEYFSTS